MRRKDKTNLLLELQTKATAAFLLYAQAGMHRLFTLLCTRTSHRPRNGVQNTGKYEASFHRIDRQHIAV